MILGADLPASTRIFLPFLDKPSGKAERPELAFDHEEIMHDAIKKYKEIVNDGLI